MRLLPILLALLLPSVAFALTGRVEIVVVVHDDAGAMSYGAYGEVPDALSTPTFDALATHVTNGQIYLNASAQPSCTPTRRSIYYGMTPLEHGAGDATLRDMPFGEGWAGRPSIVQQAHLAGHYAMHVGKFHAIEFGYRSRYALGSNGSGSGGTTAISLMGWDDVRELMISNPGVEYPDAAGSPPAVGYNHHYNWVEVDPDTGIASVSTTYTTAAFTDAAVSILQDDTDPTTPILLFVNMSAPHNPQSRPPGSSCAPTDDDLDDDCYEDAFEYVDTRMADIVAELDLDTEDTIIVISDNGPPTFRLPSIGCAAGKNAKNTATACGARVALGIRGVGITPGIVSAPVSAIDLYATLVERMGGESLSSESRSFVSCFSNPTTCTPRPVTASFTFSESHVPVPMYDTGIFDSYAVFLTTVQVGQLYGLRREWDDNVDPTVSDNWEDTLYDLGPSAAIDTEYRYGQEEIESPAGGEVTAQTRMTDEITRLIAARYEGPAQEMIGITMVGASTR